MWGVVAVAAVICVFLLLSLPVDLHVSIGQQERAQSRFQVCGLFGWICKEIRFGGAKPQRRLPRDRTRRSSRTKRGRVQIGALIRTKGFPTRCLQLFEQLYQHLKIRELNLRLKVGLDDPAETGMLFAALAPAAVCLGQLPTTNVILEPDFEKENVEAAATGTVRAVPLRILWSLILFAFSLETIRAVKAIRWGRSR